MTLKSIVVIMVMLFLATNNSQQRHVWIKGHHLKRPSSIAKKVDGKTNITGLPTYCFYRVEYDTTSICYGSRCVDVKFSRIVKECVSR